MKTNRNFYSLGGFYLSPKETLRLQVFIPAGERQLRLYSGFGFASGSLYSAECTVCERFENRASFSLLLLYSLSLPHGTRSA